MTDSDPSIEPPYQAPPTPGPGTAGATPAVPEALPVRTPRAGRNLPAAIAVGLAMAAVSVAALFVVKPLFLVVVLSVGALGVHELSSALSSRDIRIPVVPVFAGGGAMLVGAYIGGTEALSVGMALTMLACLLWRLGRGQSGFVADVTAGVFVVAYVPLLGSFVVLMLAEADGAWKVATFIAVTVASDVGGYAAGATLGKHPMAPRISPKKSWEGFAGSMLGGLLTGALMVSLALDGPWAVGLLLGACAVCLATLGDLGESLIKRDLGIKDMSSALPGHGGMMDRLDSLLAVAPVAWLVLHKL
ncbi:MAG TPA: phosphatidate cytidylyltransferase [Nocardioidaceae bacterium]|jgi:phosphatidate cytidylyltransferase|nr:phosphatidate cytidylyltransferase [Nocardioidaceae bacterium]